MDLSGWIGTVKVNLFTLLTEPFIGVSGLAQDGFYDYSLEETEMKRVFIERASNVVVLCDSHKFERLSLVKVCELGAATILVTDADPPPAIAKALVSTPD
jgi:DeoR/GlpR family transcriptional regulator of sugar metabolism